MTTEIATRQDSIERSSEEAQESLSSSHPEPATSSHHAPSASLGSVAGSSVSHAQSISNSVSVSGSASDLEAPQTPSDVDGTGSTALHGIIDGVPAIVGVADEVPMTVGQHPSQVMTLSEPLAEKRLSSSAAFEAALGLGRRLPATGAPNEAQDAELKRLSSVSNATAIATATGASRPTAESISDSKEAPEPSSAASVTPPPIRPKPHRLSSASIISGDASSRKSAASAVVAKHNVTSVETRRLSHASAASPTTPTLASPTQGIRLPSEDQRRNRVSSIASSASSSSRSGVAAAGRRPPTPPTKPANLIAAAKSAAEVEKQQQQQQRAHLHDSSVNDNATVDAAPSPTPSASNAGSWELLPAKAGRDHPAAVMNTLRSTRGAPAAADLADVELLSETAVARPPLATVVPRSSSSERGGALGIGRPSSIASSIGATSASSADLRQANTSVAEAQSAPASFVDRPTHIRKTSFSRVLDSFAVGSALRSGTSSPGSSSKAPPSGQPPPVAAKPSWLKRTASSSKNLATKSLGFATKERSPSTRTVELDTDRPGPPSLPPRPHRQPAVSQSGADVDVPGPRSGLTSTAERSGRDSLLPLPPPPRREFDSRGRSMDVPRSTSSPLAASESGNRLKTGLTVVNKRFGSWAADNQAVRQNLGQAPSMIGSAVSSGWSAIRASRSSTSASLAAGGLSDVMSPGFSDLGQIPPEIVKRPRRAGVVSTVFGQDPSQAASLWPVVDAELSDSSSEVFIRSKRRRCLPAAATRCVDFLLVCAPKEEGIFRISGRSSQVTAMKKLFDEGADLDFTIAGDKIDPHDIASLYKAYLRQLPVSILTMDTSPVFDHIMQGKLGVNALDADFGAGRLPGTEAKPSVAAEKASLGTTDGDIVTLMRDALAKLPDANWWLLADLSRLLQAIDAGKAENKMSLQNLLLVFCPTVNLSPNFLKLIVERHSELFRVAGPDSEPTMQTVTISSDSSTRFGTPIADKFARTQPIELSLRDGCGSMNDK